MIGMLLHSRCVMGMQLLIPVIRSVLVLLISINKSGVMFVGGWSHARVFHEDQITTKVPVNCMVWNNIFLQNRSDHTLFIHVKPLIFIYYSSYDKRHWQTIILPNNPSGCNVWVTGNRRKQRTIGKLMGISHCSDKKVMSCPGPWQSLFH